MEFPEILSFTLTNACNLRCRMCGQWSEEGYIRNHAVTMRPRMELRDWQRLADEASAQPVRFVLIRGGEPFLFPHIMELLRYLHGRGVALSIDTNGTLLDRHAEELSRLDHLHITFSVDGPESVHDHVRGEPGTFAKLRENLALLQTLEHRHGTAISKSICFTISNDNYTSLGMMADVARELTLSSVNIVPYYHFSEAVGLHYEEELRRDLQCTAFSWRGFHREGSGVDLERFRKELRSYLAGLGEIRNFPFMPLTEEQYAVWFTDQTTPVGSPSCGNIERLMDIQPNGEANFCIDFPDYSIGNVKESTIHEVWNSPRAERFRARRRESPLAVCLRCGAKYCAEIIA